MAKWLAFLTVSVVFVGLKPMPDLFGGDVFMPNAPGASPPSLNQRDKPLNERLAYDYVEPKSDASETIERRLSGFLSQSVEYDDNLFLQPRGQEESDVIFNSAAGVRWGIINKERPIGRLRLALSYFINYRTFVRHSRLNGFNQVLGIDLDAPLRKVLGKKLSLTVEERFRPEPLIIFDESSRDRGRRRARRQYRLVNDLSATLSYPVTGKTTVSVPYRNTYVHYLDKELHEFNFMRHSIGVRLTHDITPKTSVYGEGTVAYTHYNSSINDTIDYTARTGLNKEITQKIHVDLSAGYQYRRFVKKRGATQTYIFDGTYNHAISYKTRFNLNIFRAITETLSVADDFTGIRTVGESLRDRNPTIITTGGNALLNHFLAPRFSVYGGGGVIYTTENPGERKDWLYIARSGAAYYLRRNLTLNFDYIFTLRDSNISDSDYIRNRFILSINYGFGRGGTFVGGGVPTANRGGTGGTL